MKQLSLLLSVLLHPLVMPTLGLFLIFNTGSHISFITLEAKRIIYLVVFVSSCLLPLSLIPLLMMMKLIKSVYMESRRERVFPMFITGIFFFLGYYLLRAIPIVPAFILNYLLSILITVYAALIITFFWKISIHMIGLGGLVGGILSFSFLYGLDLHVLLSIVIIMAGMVGVARLYLKTHDHWQIYIGFITGLVLVFFNIIK